MSRSDFSRYSRRAVLSLVCGTVALYYFWASRATTGEFEWGHDLGGYYNMLGRGFAGGHIYLPVEPNPELLRLNNPWDTSVDNALKMHDMALFNGHYFLYHGAAPAVLLFTPWRMLTRSDFPENAALFLFCMGGFLFSAATVLRLLRDSGDTPGPLLLALILLATGLCTNLPFLFSRIWVYEIAIACGYFCVSAAVYFLVRGGNYALALSGFLFGAAVASRPHLILCGVIAAVWLTFFARRGKRGLAAFLLAYGCVGVAIALYNYQRFGNPLEFGLRYMVTGGFQNDISLHPHNWLPGVYFMLLAPPHFSNVFPWAWMLQRYPFDSPLHELPRHYFIEPTVGALWLAPFLFTAAIARGTFRMIAIAALAVCCFLMTTHMSTQRYEVDFLPLAVTASAGAAATFISRRSGMLRAILMPLFGVAVLFGVFVNLALGISGPYEELRKSRPLRYLSIARALSPFPETRPLLNPRIDVEFTAKPADQPGGFYEPLLSIGHNQYQIYVERTAAGYRLTSQSESSTLTLERAGTEPLLVATVYSPDVGKLITSIDGRKAFTHDIARLIAAPAGVRTGEAWADANAARRFTGTIRVLRWLVQ